MAAIELDNLTKTFGDVTALQGVDMEVEEGEIFGFLGPNGAGKSTTIDILMDFIRPTAGSAEVLGRNAQEAPREIRKRTGVLPEGFDVYERLTGYHHLEFVTEAKDADDDPDEILDEPSSGLDPNGAREMRQIVREERDRGATVFFSSHVLGQVESVCDRVAILQEGEIVAVDSVEGLRQATDVDTSLEITISQGSVDTAADAARDVSAVTGVSVDGDRLVVNVDSDAKMDVLTAIESAGVDVADFETREASLEDLFATYTEAAEVPQ